MFAPAQLVATEIDGCFACYFNACHVATWWCRLYACPSAPPPPRLSAKLFDLDARRRRACRG